VLAFAGTSAKKVKPATKRTAPAKQQPDESAITIKQHIISIEPVKITGFYVGAQRVQPNRRFTTHENWLRDLSIKVKNTSDVNVKYIELALSFDKPGGGQWIPDISLGYGWNYFRRREFPQGALDVVVTPGEKVLVGFGEEIYNSVMDVFNDAPPEAFKKLTIVVNCLVYEDIDKGWVSGFYMKRSTDGWVSDDSKVGLYRKPPKQSQIARSFNTSRMKTRQHFYLFLELRLYSLIAGNLKKLQMSPVLI